MEKSAFDKAVHEPSSILGYFTSLMGVLSVSEWCILIGAVITVLNFLRALCKEREELKMKREKHELEMRRLRFEIKKGFISEQER